MQRSRFAVLAVALAALLASCSSGGGGSQSSPVVPGHGALSITVTPNPILAQKVSGDTYDFPFTVLVREVGGAAVHIDSVSVDVTALGGLRIYSENYDAAELARRGLPTSIGPGAQLKYQFNPRKEVSDDRLFSAVEADLTARGTDASGSTVVARTTVTVRR